MHLPQRTYHIITEISPTWIFFAEDDVTKSVECRIADLSKFHLILQDPVKNKLSCLCMNAHTHKFNNLSN